MAEEGTTSSATVSEVSTSAPSSSRPSKQMDQALLEVCFQCRRKQVDKPTNYILHCLHTACRDCLDFTGTPGGLAAVSEYFCKCGRPSHKRSVVLVNKIYCKRGKCQQSLNCKKEQRFLCYSCDILVCGECLRRHDSHQTGSPKPSYNCTKHPKIPAKATCSCGTEMCHACCNGACKGHEGHTKQSYHPSFRVIDHCDKVGKGMATLQNTTKTTFDMFAKERDGLKSHFDNMRLELAKKTVDSVNLILRKMNDCALAIEMFQTSYLQKFEESKNEYMSKQASMYNFKQLCFNACDNNPSMEYLPFVTDVSNQISNDVTLFTNRLVEAIKAYSQPPEFTMDLKPVQDVLNNTAKFHFQGQIVQPPNRTDSSIPLIDVPIKELAANPRTDITAGRNPGEKRQGGPYKDALDAKRARKETDLRPSEIVGTTINHQRIMSAAAAPTLTSANRPSLMTNQPQNHRMYQKSQNPDLNAMTMAVMGSRSDPRTNPRMPSRDSYPITDQRRHLLNRIPSTTTSPLSNLRAGFQVTRPPIHNVPPPNTISNSTMLPRHSSLQPRPRTVYSPMTNMPPFTPALPPHLQQPTRAPLCPPVKTGSANMQKVLLDIIGQAGKGSQPSTPNPPPAISPSSRIPPASGSSPQPLASSFTKVITPLGMNNNSMSSSGGTPSTNPPIKLTLRRNPPEASLSTESPEKEKLTKADDWDDYCFVCNQGCDEISGELVCCESCPKVYHNVCHIPRINGDVKDLPDDWRCTRCKLVPAITEYSDSFTEREKLVCARVLLYCYEKKPGDTVQHSEPFHNPVPRTLKRYYDVVTQPICFKDVSRKIATLEYQNVQQFIEDMNLVFKNCCAFNRKGTPIELSARVVFDLYSKAVKRWLNPWHPKIWLYQNSVKIEKHSNA